MKDVAGRVAFVTGGAGGIGLGIAQAFLDAGMKVAIGDISSAHLDQAFQQLMRSAPDRVHAMLVDVTDRRVLERAAEQVLTVFGRIHVLVNNAGIQNPASLANTSYEEWDRLMNVNVGGVFNGIHAFLPRIKEHGEGGHIITTASMLGLFTAGGGYGAYCASKFAAVGMMETLRGDLCESNIGVSILCPGPVKSNLEKFLKDSELAADPLEIGQVVLGGMRNNDLYILTHPEFNTLIQHRSSTILASTPKDAHPSETRTTLAQSVLRTSIYVHQRSHVSANSGVELSDKGSAEA